MIFTLKISKKWYNIKCDFMCRRIPIKQHSICLYSIVNVFSEDSYGHNKYCCRGLGTG